ncbi:MAG: hypothetical protein JW908_08655 [Anaerolineales bacterium]|nr:hypothetical protein [Anaerolineales bacterium]
MSAPHVLKLTPRTTPDAKVTPLHPCSWRLEIPDGEAGKYRLAQLDDYTNLPRKQLLWNPPVTISLEGRASSNHIPGTWGFGLWNDPFGVSFGVQGGSRKLPTLPNCAWFFRASPPNYLSIHDRAAGQGNLAAVFRSPHIPGMVLAPALIGFPLLFIPVISRMARKWAGSIIKQEAVDFPCDLREWHTYKIVWEACGVSFLVDSRMVFQTPLTPNTPLGMVIWVDNQYAFWRPDGKIGWGTLSNQEPAWIEIRNVMQR